MASLKVVTTEERRPCEVHGVPALFHRWIERAEFTEFSVLQGGHGGVMKWTCAIVEYDDGTVDEVLPHNVRFTDTPRREGEIDKDKLISVITNEAAGHFADSGRPVPEMIIDDEEIERLADCVINYLESEVLK